MTNEMKSKIIYQLGKQKEADNIRLFLFQVSVELRALALIHGCKDFHVENDETPELIQLEVHPEFFGF